jgi:hypothetical protein
MCLFTAAAMAAALMLLLRRDTRTDLADLHGASRVTSAWVSHAESAGMG